MNFSSYHDLLNEEFSKRKQLNSSYSLRAFARDIGLAAPRLSMILNKKQGLSITSARKICQRMKMPAEQIQWFCDSVGALHSRSPKTKTELTTRINKIKKEAKKYSEIQLEYFKVISDWYHFAILELTYVKDFDSDPAWISKILSITPVEAQEAIIRMLSLGLLEVKDGRLHDKFTRLATPNDIPNLSLKIFHTQLMKKAMEALYEQDVLEREISSTVISVDSRKLPLLKEKLREFRQEFSKDAGKNEDKDEVYCLGIQFFKLSNRSNT